MSDETCNAQKSWSTEARCTAVLFGSVMVMCVYAPDSTKDFEEYEKFTWRLTKVMLEERKEGPKRFFIAGDLNIESGFLRTNENEEKKETYGGRGAAMELTQTLEGVMKAWLEVVKEFSCKAVSTWWTF